MANLSKASNVVQEKYILYDVTGFTQKWHSIPVATNCTPNPVCPSDFRVWRWAGFVLSIPLGLSREKIWREKLFLGLVQIESKVHRLISICTKPRKSFSRQILSLDKPSGIDNTGSKEICSPFLEILQGQPQVPAGSAQSRV